jgi:hypothetical protein
MRPMLRRTLRAALFTIVTVVLWTVARPAMAMPAPFCDDRGATAIAPEPLLEAPDVAVQRARIAPSCELDDCAMGAAVAPGHAPTPIPSASGDSALPVASPAVCPADSGTLTPLPAAQPRADGVHRTLERPPRA